MCSRWKTRNMCHALTRREKVRDHQPLNKRKIPQASSFRPCRSRLIRQYPFPTRSTGTFRLRGLRTIVSQSLFIKRRFCTCMFAQWPIMIAEAGMRYIAGQVVVACLNKKAKCMDTSDLAVRTADMSLCDLSRAVAFPALISAIRKKAEQRREVRDTRLYRACLMQR